jgi:hypothetical protein
VSPDISVEINGMNRSQDQYVKNDLIIGMERIRQHLPLRKLGELDRWKDRKICRKLPVKETESPCDTMMLVSRLP